MFTLDVPKVLHSTRMDRSTSLKHWQARAACTAFGSGLIGVAFNPYGGVVVCTSDTAYRLAGLV
jgi:hypothetical protein